MSLKRLLPWKTKLPTKVEEENVPGFLNDSPLEFTVPNMPHCVRCNEKPQFSVDRQPRLNTLADEYLILIRCRCGMKREIFLLDIDEKRHGDRSALHYELQARIGRLREEWEREQFDLHRSQIADQMALQTAPLLIGQMTSAQVNQMQSSQAMQQAIFQQAQAQMGISPQMLGQAQQTSSAAEVESLMQREERRQNEFRQLGVEDYNQRFLDAMEHVDQVVQERAANRQRSIWGQMIGDTPEETASPQPEPKKKPKKKKADISSFGKLGKRVIIHSQQDKKEGGGGI